MDWLQYIVQGGAIVLLAVVLVGVWRIIKDLLSKLLELISAQSEYINEATRVQQDLCNQMKMHEARAAERHAELVSVLKHLNGKR